MFGLLLPVIYNLLVISSCWLLLIGRADLTECVSSEVIMDPVEIIHDEKLLRVVYRCQILKEWISSINALSKPEIRPIVSTARLLQEPLFVCKWVLKDALFPLEVEMLDWLLLFKFFCILLIQCWVRAWLRVLMLVAIMA
jgi:hypothetical protein